MLLNKSIFSKLHSIFKMRGERAFYIALSSEEKEHDGFFFFKHQDWEEKYNIPKPTVSRYLRNLEKKGLIIRDYRRLKCCSPYPIERGSTFLFIKVINPEEEKDLTFLGNLDQYDLGICSHVSSFNKRTRAVFNSVCDLSFRVHFPYVFLELYKNDPNDIALKKIEKGNLVVFEGSIDRDKEGIPYIKNIHNIIPADNFYAKFTRD